MKSYLVLLRGVNVGGKNIVRMAALKARLKDQGVTHVTSSLASGNVVLQSVEPAGQVQRRVEATLTDGFDLDDELIKALALEREQFRKVIDEKPEGFGDQPDKYHSDVIFMIEIDVAEAMTAFDPREGVDRIWPGDGVIYSQRLSAARTKSRLSKVMASPLYKSMTIRSWSTTVKLWDMVRDADGEDGA